MGEDPQMPRLIYVFKKGVIRITQYIPFVLLWGWGHFYSDSDVLTVPLLKASSLAAEAEAPRAPEACTILRVQNPIKW